MKTFFIIFLFSFFSLLASDFEDLIISIENDDVLSFQKNIKQSPKYSNEIIINNYGDTPFLKAAARGKIKIVKYLLNQSININKCDRYGQTALHLAAQNGYIEIVKLLIKYGAFIDKAMIYGDTPLQFASYDHEEIVKILLSNGASTQKCRRQTTSIIKYIEVELYAKKLNYEMPHVQAKDQKLIILNTIFDFKYDFYMPLEIYLLIISNMFDLKDIYNLRLISKFFHQLINKRNDFKEVVNSSICIWNDVIRFGQGLGIDFESQSN